ARPRYRRPDPRVRQHFGLPRDHARQRLPEEPQVQMRTADAQSLESVAAPFSDLATLQTARMPALHLPQPGVASVEARRPRARARYGSEQRLRPDTRRQREPLGLLSPH